jgi:hypothetical protein
MKDLKVNDIVKLCNEDKETEYKVIERNDETQDPPEYTFENVETGEIHGPVFWNWLDGAKDE